MPKPRRSSTTLRGAALFIEKLKPVGFSYDQPKYTQLELHEPKHLEVLADSNRLPWTMDEWLRDKKIRDAVKKTPSDHQSRLEAIIAAAMANDEDKVKRFAQETAKRVPDIKENAGRIRLALEAVAKNPRQFIRAVSDLREADPRVHYFRITHDKVDLYRRWLADELRK